ncbi:RHS repeat-associated core domain-containing protein [Pantoea sp. Ap-967]|uniref:RHS repeat-associated core domain-containing protein n=1 Tax=Pantoea sp. Ap-967 TaxID=2608362 RepID=UPI00351BCBC9
MTDQMPIKAYTAYGFQHGHNSIRFLSSFNGEVWYSEFCGYLLGNGHRVFSPVRMRFNSSDSASPFAKGGINSYAYCGGDPLNFTDPTGMSRFYLHRFMPSQRKNTPSQPVQHTPAISTSYSLKKNTPSRNFLTLKDLSHPVTPAIYNDYSDAQLINKARRFNELIIKEDARIKNTKHTTSKHFQAMARYRSNLDSLEMQFNTRHPKLAQLHAITGSNFWGSDSGSSIHSSARSGVLSHQQSVESIRESRT